MKRVKRQTGDVIAIPLPDGTFACARLYNGAAIGIFGRRWPKLPLLDDVKDAEPAFWLSCFSNSIKNGDWPVIGYIPFKRAADADGPPTYIEDELAPGNYSIYHKGDVVPATKAEIAGLEEQALWRPASIVKIIESRLSKSPGKRKSSARRKN